MGSNHERKSFCHLSLSLITPGQRVVVKFVALKSAPSVGERRNKSEVLEPKNSLVKVVE